MKYFQDKKLKYFYDWGWNLQTALPDPRHDNKEARWKIVGDDVERHFPGEQQLEAGDAVVHADGDVVGVGRLQGVKRDAVVQNGFYTRLFWNKLDKKNE